MTFLKAACTYVQSERLVTSLAIGQNVVSGTLIRSGFSSDDGTERLPLAWKDLLRDVYLQDEIVLLFDLLRPIFNRSKSEVICETASGSVKRADAMECIVSGWEPQKHASDGVRSASPEPCARRYLEYLE